MKRPRGLTTVKRLNRIPLVDLPQISDEAWQAQARVPCTPCFGGNHQACWRQPCCCQEGSHDVP